MKKLYKDRLLKLASYLEKLPKQKFNFATVWDENCKTTACAMGSCPIVFPKDWVRAKYPNNVDNEKKIVSYAVILKKKEKKHGLAPDNDATFEDAEEYFGISDEEASALFNPNDSLEDNGETILEGCKADASPKMVAKEIRKFVKYKSAT